VRAFLLAGAMAATRSRMYFVKAISKPDYDC
jgi:hypothetical protein